MLVRLASLLIGVVAADSTPRPITQLVHTRWTAKDGAPTELRALAQTSDGYLWLGTLSGLVRFDGVRFVQFAPRGTDSLPSGGVRRLLATRDGSLWIAWRSGAVSRLNNGRVTSYGERDGLATTFHLTESSTGILVAGTSNGLARFVDGKWKDVSRDWRFPGAQGRAVWFDHDDVLWAQTEDRMVYLPSSSHQFVDPSMLLEIGPAAAEFAQAKDGSIWMAELYRSAHTVRQLGDARPISEVMVGAITLLIDRKGALWVGSVGDGLRRIIDPTGIGRRKIAQFGPEAERFTEKDGLLSDVIYALVEDIEGNIWVATGRGLERFREGPFTPMATSGSVRPRWVYATADTSVWTAAFGVNEILRVTPRGQERIPTPGFLVQTLFRKSLGALWTVDGAKILRVEGRRFIPLPLRPTDARRLTDITVDSSGTVWVYDEDLGLLRVERDSLVRVASLHRPAFPHSSLLSDRRGRVWVAQLDRVALYDHGRLTLFGAAEGIAPGVVNSIFEDRGGNIWAAGEGGLSKFERGRFRKLSARNGIPGQAVFSIAEDDGGALWIANQTGVLRVPPGEVDGALTDSTHVVRYRRFDLGDGLPGMVRHSTWGPLVTRARDGRIWVATDSGLASVDPLDLPLGVAPAVLIEAVRFNGRELAPSETIAIPGRSGDLEIDYTATSLSIPERVQFRYQLEGEDREWRDVGTRRRAYYTALAPGPYRFRVIASNGDGVWNEAGTTWAFRVLPAWYQTLWFRTGIVLLIGALGAAAAAAVQRSRHLRVQAALRGQYEATLAERSRIAQDLHDTLMQGFAGVTLQLKAAELALPEEPDVAAETIMRVQQLAKQSLREARERVWDMRETDLGGDDLPQALEALARERTAGSATRVTMSTAGSRQRLTRIVEDAAFRIAREAIVNAVRHADASRIEIQLDFRAASLRLEVRDDGRGFTAEVSEDARRRGHFGLSGARERAARMGGKCEVLGRQGGGTIVTLELPLGNGEPAR